MHDKNKNGSYLRIWTRPSTIESDGDDGLRNGTFRVTEHCVIIITVI